MAQEHMQLTDEFFRNLPLCDIKPDGEPVECRGFIESTNGRLMTAACVEVCMLKTQGLPKPDPNQFSLFDSPGFTELLREEA